MLGTRMVLDDGRVYRYSKSGAAITIGKVCSIALQSAGLAIDNLCSAVSARTTAQWDAGTNTVIVATTASASTATHIYANRFNDGYVWMTDQAGEGQLLQIKSHGTSASGGSTRVAITAYEDDLLTVALTTASQVGLIKNLYDGVITHTGTTGGGPAVGVTPVAVGAANTYFWLQTWGPCPVLMGATLPLTGEQVICGNSTGGDTGLVFSAGTVYPAGATKYVNLLKTATYNPRIGVCITPATADADFGLVYLTLAP